MTEPCRPMVDVFMVGLCLGAALALGLAAYLHHRFVEDMRRRYAFGAARHPSQRGR